MDQRKLKTRQAIEEAFLLLRKDNSLEQISVTELSRLARISKATFYLHYRDIFDLSEKLQKTAIRQVLDQIHISIAVLDHWPEFAEEIMRIMDHNAALSVLFSGAQMATVPILLEDQIRGRILEQSPELKENSELSIRLTYHIQGSYHAYLRHAHHTDIRKILDIIDDIQHNIGINSTKTP